MSEIETGTNMCPLLFKKEPRVLFREEEECMVDVSKMYINKGQDDQMEVEFFRRNFMKSILTYMGFILTCGLLRLLYHWVPHLYLFSTSTKCKIEDAQYVLISENFQEKHIIYHVRPIKTLTADKIDGVKHEDDDISKFSDELSVNFGTGVFQNVKELLSFAVKETTYIYDRGQKAFVKLPGLDSGVTCDKFHRLTGLASSENFMRRIVYGLNLILIKESSVLTLLWLEVLNPFYIFQVVSTILWICSQYYYYPIAIFLMSFYSASMIIRQTKKNQRNLKATLHSSDYYTVLRPTTTPSSNLNDCPTKVIPTSLLVPGDIIEIPSFGCIMHCDAVLLTGTCVVNEAMLTGESVPVTKTALPNLPDVFYDTKTHARHTLFCGTSVIQTRYLKNEKVLAAVVRTGYSTSKGGLVRSILYPPPVDYRFEKDSYKFVVFLGLIALVGFVYTVITKVMAGISAKELILQALDLITIVVPPALPAAMSVGRYYAQKRLERKKISCISPRSINVSGGIDCVCFDKTGTLTEEGLDLLCVVPSDGKTFGSAIKNVTTMSYNDKFLCGLVCCHSLTVVDNQVVGDPLDFKMFESTKWVIDESHTDNNKYNELVPTVLKPPSSSNVDATEDCLDIGMLKQFPFSSSAQRMGVIVRKLNGSHFEYYCKGSPEMILNFVKKETVPIDFADTLESYAQKGYRVIAMAHRELKMNYAKVQKASREVLEKDLTFLGFIVLENRLKPKSLPSIEALNEANIRVVMATGDNILTAISVARDCKIVLPSQNIITVSADANNPPNLCYTLNGKRKKIEKDLSLESGLTEITRLTSDTESDDSDNESDENLDGSGGFVNNYRFALTGKTWDVIKENYPELLAKICSRGSVFARMSPEQKQQLIQELQSLDYCVAMCGDGANDCGALKAAHTGISLSEAESSVASPFTSRNPDISCVLDVIREGRAALTTSFGVFKYMAGYSLCQFVSVLILYSVGSNLTDLEYLHIDLGIITTFAFYFGKTEAYPGKLHKRPPLTSLISFAPILSLLVNVLLIVLFQVLAFSHLQTEPWYVPNNKTDPFDVGCFENYTVFSISSFQYIILAVVFSKGYPYRKSIFTNYHLVLSAILMTVCSVYLTLYPAQMVQDYMEIVLPPSFDFRLYLVGYAAVHFVLSLWMEYIVDKVGRYKGCCVSKTSRKKYKGLERVLKCDQFWPPFKTDSEGLFSDPVAASPRIEIVMEMVDNFEKGHALNGLYVAHEDTLSSKSLDTSSPLAARNWQDRKRER